MNEQQVRRLEKKFYERKAKLPDCANDFLRSLQYHKELQTQLEYAKDIHLFLEYLSEHCFENLPVKEITIEHLAKVTEEDAMGFIDYITQFKREFISVGGNKTIQEFTNGPHGKERKRASIKKFYDYFLTRGKLGRNPMMNIEIKVKKKPIKPRLSYSEVSLMLDTALTTNPHPLRALRNYVILKVLAYTGIRISELTGIDIDDIWEHRDEMIVTRKGGYQEVIYINQNIREDLYHYLNERKEIKNVQKGHQNALFLSQQMRRIDPRSVRKMIRTTAEKAGIKITVTPHTFRRTFGWKHYNDNKDLGLTASVLGHESTEVIRKSYADADDSRSRKSLDSFSY